MKRFCILLLFLGFAKSLLTPTQAYAVTTEQKFKDLFTTAGYATAFGAALGAAALSFRERPENHLRYVAIGASLGFIGGSLMGSYIIFSPMMTVDNNSPLPLSQQIAKLEIRPYYDLDSKHLNHLEGSFLLSEF